jgi:uncharacterized protein
LSAAVTRRGVFARLVAAAAAGAVVFKATEALAEDTSGVPSVCYHLSDLEKVSMALGNINNHIKGMGGPDKVRIVLVVKGPALGGFKASDAAPDLSQKLKRIRGQGVELGACGNTLDGTQMTVADLLPGFVRIDEGGVVRLAMLQAEGYAYIRP